MRKKPPQKVYAIFTAQEIGDALQAKYPERYEDVPISYIMRFFRHPWSIQLVGDDS